MTDSLPPCSWRRRLFRREDLFFCAHPGVSSQNDVVTPAVCLVCAGSNDAETLDRQPTLNNPLIRRDPCVFLEKDAGSCPNGNVDEKPVTKLGCSHPFHPYTSVYDCALCDEYEPPLKKGGVREWAVGVVTAPREGNSTLSKTLGSLRDAGWSELFLFAEPGVMIPAESSHLTVVQRQATLGAWPNWYLGLAELYMRHPWADAFMMVQDDVVFCRNIRGLLEETLWPDAQTGVVSVYCPTPYRHSSVGFFPVSHDGDLVGALTYIFPNVAVRSLLADENAVAHRRRQDRTGLKYVDVAVGKWAHHQDKIVYYHYPSLAQHTGDQSTAWPGALNQGKRRACSFVGEAFDAEDFLQTSDHKSS